MKKCLSIVLVFSILGFPQKNYALDFGATAVMVGKLIAQHVQELAKLQEIIRQGKDAYRLANDVHRGIQNTLRILQNLEDNLDPGTFKRLKLNLERIVGKVERIYGKIPNTARKETLMLHDQTVVDTISRHNQIYEDHQQMKEERRWIEDEIRSKPSPSRSAQLTVSVEYEILKALSRIEKNQAQALKLLALNLGMKNEFEKKQSEQTIEQYDALYRAFDSAEFDGGLPSVK